MQITDLHTKKKREIRDLKVVSHKEYDKKGKKCTNQYAEFTVVGKNSQWEDFMPLKDFKKLNPKVDI